MAAHEAPQSLGSSGKKTRVGCHFLLQCMKVKSESEVAQSCPTLSSPMDCSLWGSSIMGFSRQEFWSGVLIATWVWVNSESWWWTWGLVCCNSWGCKESNTTEGLHCTELRGASVSWLSLSVNLNLNKCNDTNIKMLQIFIPYCYVRKWDYDKFAYLFTLISNKLGMNPDCWSLVMGKI